MSADSELSYTRQELLDYLPPGWTLEDRSGAGGWNDRRNRWEVRLRDIADVDWQLAVNGKAAAKAGRIEALKEAFDHLFRQALGGPGLFG